MKSWHDKYAVLNVAYCSIGIEVNSARNEIEVRAYKWVLVYEIAISFWLNVLLRLHVATRFMLTNFRSSYGNWFNRFEWIAEGVRAGAKAASIACVVTAVPTVCKLYIVFSFWLSCQVKYSAIICSSFRFTCKEPEVYPSVRTKYPRYL